MKYKIFLILLFVSIISYNTYGTKDSYILHQTNVNSNSNIKSSKEREIEVLTFEKVTDSSSIHFKESAQACTNWLLNKDKIQTILTYSEAIDGHEWHYFYLDLPCYYSGEVMVDSEKASYSIYAGAVSYLKFSDTIIRLGYKKGDFKKYFIEGRQQPEE